MTDAFATPIAGHKEGCIWGDDPANAHRTPVDCVTIADLCKALGSERDRVRELKAEIVTLKARLYDLEHQDEEE